MSMGRREGSQGSMWVAYNEIPRGPGHRFYENRARGGRKKGKALQRKRGELVERTFAHICETGAARRTRLRGLDNVNKRYLIQASGANLGLVMRSLFGRGTPRGMLRLCEDSHWLFRAAYPIEEPLWMPSGLSLQDLVCWLLAVSRG